LYLTEYHIHSQLSFDGQAPLEEMARNAMRAGIQELCVTDHCDTIDENANRVYDYDWAPALKQFQETKERLEGKIILKLGLEYGMGHVDPPMSDRILAQPALDFVIGSVHNLSLERGNGFDFYYSRFETEQDCRFVLDDYFDSLEKVARSPYYDVLGHVIYPLRYMKGLVTIEPWLDWLTEIMRLAVERGKGIELNTNRARTLEEWRPVLKRYKEIGGEIITVGSDAHDPAHAGLGIASAYELMREFGFRYVATYENRKPQMKQI